MRKFTLFLSLIVAFVTATAQEVTVTSLDQLSNDKTYFIESARCFLMNNTTANAAGISTSNAKNLGTSTVAKDWTDANQQFKIENIDGNYYLYSVGAAKYVAKDGSWSDTAVDALEFTPSSNSTYNWKLCIGGNGMNSQEPGQMDAGIVVNGWTTEDPGNCYKILDTEASTIVVVDYPNELAEFDQNKCYTVTTTSRGGWAVKDNQFCSTVDAALGTNSNPEDANQQFAVLSIDGENYYLYSVGAQMFVNSDKSLVAGIGEAIELTDASKMGDCRVRVNFKGYSDKYINLGGSKQMEVNNWGTIDAGNAVAFIEAGEFDPTAALAMLQPATELQALEVASTERNPLETAINGQYKLQGVKINFNEVVKKYTTDLTGDYGYILDAEGNEVAKLNKCMGGNGTNNTFATPYSATAIETPGTYKVVVNPGVILSADGTKEYKGGEFEFTVAERPVEVSPSAEEGFCWNETFNNVADFSEFVITVKYAKSDVVINNDVKATMTTGETVYEATVTVEKSGTTQYITLAFDGEFAEGRYTINVPAGLFTVDGVANEEYAQSTFTYKKPQLEITRDFDSWESYLDQVWYMPKGAIITIANAESVEVDETKVATIAVGENVYNSTLNWYYDNWSNAYYIELTFEDFYAEGFEFVKGDYTFTLPAGLYTVNGVANEEAVKTYTYGDPIVEEFTVTNVLPAPGSTLESLDAISITFSNGMKPDMLPITCGEKTYYFIYMQGMYVAVDLMSYEPIVITEPGTYTLDLSELEGLTGDKVFSWTIAEVAPALAVVSQTPAADEVVESFNAITIEFNKDIEFIQAAGGTGTDIGTSGPAQYIKLKDANNGVVATAWVSAATIDGNKVTFVFEMNASISKTGTYSFAIPAGLIKATDGEEFAGETFTFQVEEPVKLAVVSQTPAADEVVESFNAITIEFNKDIEFIQAAGGTGTDIGTSGPAQYIKLKDANNGVVATAWVSAATIDGNKVTFVFEMNASISKTGTYSFAIPAGLIKATDGEEFAGETFTFQVEEPVKLAVVSQTPAADEVVESFSSITIEFNKAIEFIQAAGGTDGTGGTGGTNGTDATGGTNGTTGGTDGTGGTGGTSGPAQYIKLKDANNGVVATAWVSAATIDGNKVTFVFEMNATITNPGTYTFTIPAGLIKATDGEEFAGETFTFEVSVPEGIEDVDAEVENDVIYDLSGRRIVEITKSGIYIVNGKKVLVK